MAGEEMPTGMEMRSHERTYGGFTTLMKWGTVVAVIVVAIVILILL